jgi:hypothetical protein
VDLSGSRAEPGAAREPTAESNSAAELGQVAVAE